MFRTRKKAQEAKGKLRRLLSEQLENRQLMASDMMQWAPIPSHLIATPSSAHSVSGAILSTQFSGHARTTMFNNAGFNMNLGQPILVGRVDLSQMSQTTVFANRGPASPLSGGPVVEGRIEVSKLDPNNLPKDGSFGKATEVAMGDSEAIEFSEAILVGDVELADVTPVTEFAFGDADAIEFGEAILVGEVELADVIPVTEVLTGKVIPASPLSSGPVVEGRIEVSKLDPNNLPKDGSFGKTTEVAMGETEAIEFSEAILVGDVELADVIPVTEFAFGDADAIEFGEAILVGEVELADVIPSTEALTVKVTPASPRSSGPVDEGRIEVSKLDPNNLPKDGSFGKTTEVAMGETEAIEFSEAILVGDVELADVIPVTEFAIGDADAIEFGEAILVGEVELADVIPVTEVLTGKVTPASPLSSGPVVEERIEVSKLDPNNLPKDGSFGKATEIAVGDAYLIEFGEAILMGEVELADLVPVTEVLTGKVTPASPLSSGPVVEGRIEVSKLDPSNLPKDGSFGKTTVIAPSKELPSSTEKKTFVSSATWNGESVQRKRSSGSLRNQLVDSALIDLFQL